MAAQSTTPWTAPGFGRWIGPGIALCLALSLAIPAAAQQRPGQVPPPKCVASAKLDGCSLVIPPDLLPQGLTAPAPRAPAPTGPAAGQTFPGTVNRLDHSGDSFDPLLKSAEAARQRGDFNRALADLDEAVKRRPQSALAHHLRGQVLADKGELERAVDSFAFAIRLKPDFPEAIRARGFTQYKRREFVFALEDFARLLPANPGDVEIVAARGDMFVRMGEWDQAITELNRELALRPGHYLAVARRGDAWRGKGRIDVALDDYAMAARMAPAYWPVRHASAAIHEERGDYAKALADYDAVLRASPRHVPTLAQRCGVKVVLDRLADALPDCEAALALKPDDQVALTWSGLIDYANGAFDRARAELDAAIEQNGAWARANYARALVRETLGDQAGAFRDMTSARRYTETPADWTRVQTEMSRFRRGPWCGERLPCGTIHSGNIPDAGCGCGP
jgi:tetratricopeptide (TPR) repeat protein